MYKLQYKVTINFYYIQKDIVIIKFLLSKRLNMYYNLDIKHQLQRIFANISFTMLDSPLVNSKDGYITDMCDGLLYKKLLDSEDGRAFKTKEAFSFTINTDGASICKKSNLTIWPVYLTINELPINIRFAPENVILAGINI